MKTSRITIKSSNTEEKMTNQTYDTAKASASSTLGGLTEKLRRLEDAMAEEQMGAVYQIYWRELPESLQQTVNKNHEFDDFLTNKLQREFESRFPFMIVQNKLSPTLVDYKIGSYYHDRATIQIDAAQPKITIFPAVKEQWLKASEGKFKKQLIELQKELNQLDAKIISAKSEIAELDKQIEEAETEKDHLEHNRGILNRKKMDEEIAVVDQKIAALKEQRTEWLPYLNSDLNSDDQKQTIAREIKEIQLREAIALKELRLIKKRFGNLKEMEKSLNHFLKVFLGKEAN